jgi:hypothetical protein
MSMNIGSTEVPIVSNISFIRESEVSELQDGFKSMNPVPVQHTPSPVEVSILAFLNEEVHSSGLSLESQKNNIEQMQERDISDNSIDYKELTGHLLVKNVNFQNTGNSRIAKEVTIEATYFPAPKYSF